MKPLFRFMTDTVAQSFGEVYYKFAVKGDLRPIYGKVLNLFKESGF